jgi:ABC-type phosphonate transport system ATPase subunit
LLNIATNLFLSKKLVILDEPTCGMDFPSKIRFVDLINAFPELAMLIITHDQAIEGLGKRIEMQERLK